MTDWEKKIIAEARLLCLANCWAAFCVDAQRCRSIWPGPGGTLSMYFKEAEERVKARERDSEQLAERENNETGT